MISLEQIFKTQNSTRDKFLSRLFGLFSESIVRIWCRTEEAPYQDLGRPVLRRVGANRSYTLDFTLRSKETDNIYVCEMKSWMEYENYRYLTLSSATQLQSISNIAFRMFLEIAKQPTLYPVKVNRSQTSIAGSILIWGRIDQNAAEQIKVETGIAELISLEQIVCNLIQSNNQEFINFLGERAAWSRELFQSLSDNRFDSGR